MYGDSNMVFLVGQEWLESFANLVQNAMAHEYFAHRMCNLGIPKMVAVASGRWVDCA